MAVTQVICSVLVVVIVEWNKIIEIVSIVSLVKPDILWFVFVPVGFLMLLLLVNYCCILLYLVKHVFILELKVAHVFHLNFVVSLSLIHHFWTIASI